MSEVRAGRYRLEEVIGVGSFATVHRAVDDRLDDTVVVKILAENHSLNPEVRERFIAEGRALRRVNSPHVVTVHDIGESDRQQPFLVLELAERGTLAQRVETLHAEGWTAATADVLVVARQLASALEAVHTARLVHRDLSPSNVLIALSPDPETHAGRLLDADERLVVADLGMCKDLAVNSGLTVAGGTAGYRPPEMDAGPAVIDARADLWSLSALLRWVCRDAALPDAFWNVLDRGQSLDPNDRQADVTTWLAQVEEALAPPPPEPGSVASERFTPAGAGSAPAPPGRRRAIALALGATTAVLGFGGGWLLGHTGGPSATTDSASLEIAGPTEVQVGETATFTLRQTGVESWVWILPTGQHLADTDTVSVTPRGAGAASIVVTARDAEGRELEDTHEFTVTAAQ